MRKRKMRKLEMKKIIQSRAKLSNYSAITDIIWSKVRGIGATKWNEFDDVIYFSYKNNRYRLESKYTGAHSALQKHSLATIE